MKDRALKRAAAHVTIIAIGAIGFALAISRSKAQDEMPAHAQAVPASQCDACHSCDAPTKDDPCLNVCPRPREAEEKAAFAKKQPPKGVILLNMLALQGGASDNFGPVPFDHGGHAAWAEIAGGCSVCHHYTPEGMEHPACRTCHDPNLAGGMGKPGLKGAYHRQCLGCHREWSHEQKCKTCHLSRVGNGHGTPAEAVTPEDIIGVMHPPIPEPVMEAYQTKYPEGRGSKVYFHHKRHAELYQLRCAECHKGNNCERCHEPGKKHVQSLRTFAQHHELCSVCHEIDGEKSCEHCHRLAGETEPQPFTHARTGWPLSDYHKKLGCRQCHKKMPFKALDTKCTSCHDWDPSTFDHKVTGLALNEIHSEIDCEMCHVDGFDQKPKCTECHDADDVSFPTKYPGTLLRPKQ